MTARVRTRGPRRERYTDFFPHVFPPLGLPGRDKIHLSKREEPFTYSPPPSITPPPPPRPLCWTRPLASSLLFVPHLAPDCLFPSLRRLSLPPCPPLLPPGVHHLTGRIPNPWIVHPLPEVTSSRVTNDVGFKAPFPHSRRPVPGTFSSRKEPWTIEPVQIFPAPTHQAPIPAGAAAWLRAAIQALSLPGSPQSLFLMYRRAPPTPLDPGPENVGGRPMSP